MVNRIEWNVNHGQRDLRLFELGKKYGLEDGAPVEIAVLTVGAAGLAREKGICEEARDYSFADLKGNLDQIGELAGGFSWQAGGPPWLAPARAAQLSLGLSGWPGARAGTRKPDGRLFRDGPIGFAGQLSPGMAEDLKLRQEVFVAELELEPLLGAIESARAALRFKPLPRFPAVERDFSLVLDDGVRFAEVAETVAALGIPELQSIEPADLFRGGQVPAGKLSLMIRATFQSEQRTLTDAQIADFSSRIVAALEEKLGATLRTS